MPKKKKKHTSPAENAESLHFDCAASRTECTGLIPTPPENEDEAESYREIYDYGPTESDEIFSRREKNT